MRKILFVILSGYCLVDFGLVFASSSKESLFQKSSYSFLSSLTSCTLKFFGCGRVLRNQLFPLDQEPLLSTTVDESHIVELETLDGLKLRANYYPPKKENTGVVVMFHGNGMTGDSWQGTEELKWFRELGLGVITPTIRGYPGSQGSCRADMDKSFLLDTEAVYRFLVKEKKISPKKILSFGISLGGAYATTLAHYFRTPLILHNSWTRLGEVIGNIAGSMPDCIANPVGRAASTWTSTLPEISLGMYSEIGLTKEDLIYDSGDNIRKLEEEASRDKPIDTLIIFAYSDQLMGGSTRAEQLHHARYPKDERYQKLIGIEGDHGSFFCSVNGYDGHNYHKNKVKSFLLTNKLIDSE